MLDRVLGFLRTKPAAQDEDIDRRIAPRGTSGTQNYKGLLWPTEYNVDLRGLAGLKVWERMRRSDPGVRETIWHVNAPIMNASWGIEPPANPDELEREITAFAHHAIFEWMEMPWMELLGQILTYLPRGAALFESELMVVTKSLVLQETGEEEGAEPTSSDPEKMGLQLPPEQKARTLPERQFITWSKLGQRGLETIEEWHSYKGRLKGVTQNALFDTIGPDGKTVQEYRKVDLDARDLILFTNEKEGDEWTGLSILRSAYKPWVFKELIEKIAGMAYERHGVGIPVVYLPREREDDDELADRIETMLQNLRAGEYSYMVFPGPKAMGNISGYTFEIVSPDGGIPDFKPILEYFRGEIAGAVLARFKELGHAQTGARATANVQAEVWYNALHAIARYIEGVMNPALRKLIDMNYPNVNRYPKLKASGIEARNLLEFAQAMRLLVDAELVSPDDPTRAWARAEIDAPAEDAAAHRRSQALQLQEKKMEMEATAAKTQMERNPAQTARPRTSKTNPPS